MNPKIDFNSTNYVNLKTGYIPQPKRKATCWSLFSQFGDCIVERKPYSAIAAKIRAIGKVNAKTLKKIAHYD
jgi:hypothetical protein